MNTPKVVIIGDGFAEGIGDWVVMGGMAGVTRLLENHAGSDDKVCALAIACCGVCTDSCTLRQ